MGLFGKHAREGRLKNAIEMAKAALDLSPQQETQITEMLKQFREERQQLKNSGGDTAREQIRSKRRETKQKILAVLNDDQKRILEENLAKRNEEAD